MERFKVSQLMTGDRMMEILLPVFLMYPNAGIAGKKHEGNNTLWYISANVNSDRIKRYVRHKLRQVSSRGKLLIMR